MSEKQAPAWLEVSKLLVESARVLVWPVLVVAAFIAFHKPLMQLAEDLPRKFSAATKVGVGSLVLEIQQQASASGSPELARSLGKLSPEAIKHLIEMGQSRMILVGTGPPAPDGSELYSLPDESRLRVLRELAANGLIDFGEDLDRFLAWIGTRFKRVPPIGQSSLPLIAPDAALSPAELDRLKRQSYRLNELGRKAWQTVLDAVLAQLNAASPAAR